MLFCFNRHICVYAIVEHLGLAIGIPKYRSRSGLELKARALQKQARTDLALGDLWLTLKYGMWQRADEDEISVWESGHGEQE